MLSPWRGWNPRPGAYLCVLQPSVQNAPFPGGEGKKKKKKMMMMIMMMMIMMMMMMMTTCVCVF